MNNILILDFNRTLFDPTTNRIMDAAPELLAAAQQKGYTMVLLAKAAPSRRNVIAELGLDSYFAEIMLVTSKSERMFRDIAARYNADLTSSYVIGDRAHGEILYGHKAGWRTIWLQAGAFAAELPQDFLPHATVNHLKDILSLI